MPQRRVIPILSILLAALLLMALLAAVAPTATAQSGGGYDLTWSTVDGGGGQSIGGGYTLTGTAGQADAGTQSGGSYAVGSGFWAAFTQALYRLFVPVVTK